MVRYRLIKEYPGYEGNLGQVYTFTSNAHLDPSKWNEFWEKIVDDFVLPEKWCLKVTDDNLKTLISWRESLNLHNIDSNEDIKYYKYIKQSGYGSGHTYDIQLKIENPEITFEQFKKYVLKEEEKPIVIAQSHSDTLKLQSKGIDSIVLPIQKVKKDYEILSFKDLHSSRILTLNLNKQYYQDGNMYLPIKNLLPNIKNWQIHSIKRNSDGEIFTIGDTVIFKYNKGLCLDVPNYAQAPCAISGKKIIEGFSIINNQLGIKTTYNRFYYSIDCPEIIKQPLFTTEDGVDIFEGDNLYSIDNMLNIRKHLLFNARYDDNTLLNNRIFFNSDYKHFSTLEKAEEYILINKPLLSLSDVWDNLKVKDQKEVLKFVKSKLNK